MSQDDTASQGDKQETSSRALDVESELPGEAGAVISVIRKVSRAQRKKLDWRNFYGDKTLLFIVSLVLLDVSIITYAMTEKESLQVSPNRLQCVKIFYACTSLILIFTVLYRIISSTYRNHKNLQALPAFTLNRFSSDVETLQEISSYSYESRALACALLKQSANELTRSYNTLIGPIEKVGVIPLLLSGVLAGWSSLESSVGTSFWYWASIAGCSIFFTVFFLLDIRHHAERSLNLCEISLGQTGRPDRVKTICEQGDAMAD